MTCCISVHESRLNHSNVEMQHNATYHPGLHFCISSGSALFRDFQFTKVNLCLKKEDKTIVLIVHSRVFIFKYHIKN